MQLIAGTGIDHQHAARPQYAKELGERPAMAGEAAILAAFQMMQHLVDHDAVELPVVVGQRKHAGLIELDNPRRRLIGQLGARDAEHAGAHVDRVDPPDLAGQRVAVGPGAAAGVEQGDLRQRPAARGQAAGDDAGADRHSGPVIACRHRIVLLICTHGAAPWRKRGRGSRVVERSIVKAAP